MSFMRTLAIEIVCALLRVLPLPTRTGLRAMGRPGPESPVVLTGNYLLTVDRVRRALRGLDAWLLVANSRGVNVWCAATGGLLTQHDVISVLKTSGVSERVAHRRVILPQLAATGVEGVAVHKRTGWNVDWGPVDARDLPAFVRSGEKTPAMRTVRFPWPARLEMAVAWAFPISLLALPLLPFLGAGVGPLVALVWALSLAIFLAFPLYAPQLRDGRVHRGFILFDVGERGLPLVAWGLFLAGYLAWSAATGTLSGEGLVRWGAASLVVLAILCLDLTGSTPIYKSGLHPDRRMRIRLDAERCRGAGFCELTCPVGVFRVDPERKLATLPRASHCVQCGACIVQCPFDALYFEDPAGQRVPPQIVRRFKLNLMGERAVAVDREPAEPA